MRLNIDSYRYMAPEVIQPELSGGNRLKESDVYSLAMTAYKVSLPLIVSDRHFHCCFVIRFSQIKTHMRRLIINF